MNKGYRLIIVESEKPRRNDALCEGF